MTQYLLTSLIVICISSCSTPKNWEVTKCDTVYFSNDNLKNDTSKIALIEAGVYDTTMCIIKGSVFDGHRNSPMGNITLSLMRKAERLTATTNDKGEFEFSRSDLRVGKWELLVAPKNYSCLTVRDINQFEGSFGFIQCQVKLYKPQ